MLTIFSPEMKSKSEEPSYYTDGEAMFREKFSENLQMVEDIITSFGDDGDQLTKSKESTDFRNFCSALWKLWTLMCRTISVGWR